MSCCETVWGEKEPSCLFRGEKSERGVKIFQLQSLISSTRRNRKSEENFQSTQEETSLVTSSKVKLAFIDNLIWKTSLRLPRERYVKVDTNTSSRAALTDNENRSNLVKMWNYSRENWIIPRGGKKGIERLLTSYIGERFEIKQRRKMKIGGEESSSVKCRIRKFRQIFLPFLILSVVLLDTQTKVFLVKNGKS